MIDKKPQMSMGSLTNKPKKPELSHIMFGRFSDMIYGLSGIRFQENKAYFLSSKLNNRLVALGMDSMEAYYAYLESPSGRTEYGHLIDEITINETFFYRHQPQLESFKNEVLMPMVFHKKTNRQTKLRIWSCAASTGDEAYTIALMIKESALDRDLDIEIVGTDICSDALKKAREGVYKQYAIRNIPDNQLKQHFIHDPIANSYLLNDNIKRMVTFKEANLMDGLRLGAIGKIDIAFCRNVLIYFDDKSKSTVVKNIYNSINPDGVLLLGHSENVYGQRHLFVQDKTRSAAIAYTKQPSGTEKHKF